MELLGNTLGPYHLEGELGSGGMGTVYLAEVRGEEGALPIGERVAVKVVHPHLVEVPGLMKRFQRELSAGRRIAHENVVRTLDGDLLVLGETPILMIVTEYVRGRTLRGLLAELGTVPEALLREIAGQIVAGLDSIHAAGVVHRDLKPENVLITEDRRIRIMDLGVARLIDESVALTGEGRFAGSLPYAAPEQFRRSKVGPAADLYALGVLLYELASGTNPFVEVDAVGVMNAHLELVPERLDRRDPDLSDFLAEVVAVLLEKDPGSRFGSAADLGRILAEEKRSAWWAERQSSVPVLRRRAARIPVGRKTAVVGRDAELGRLLSHHARAGRRAGRTVLLEGEAGIGKTRLVDQLVREIAGDETRVLYGSYPPSGGPGGLSDAIVAYFGEAALEERLRSCLDAAPSMLRGFLAALGHEPPPDTGSRLPSETIHTLFVRLLRGLAAERPLLWIVEDLHFAEPEDCRILISMARAVADHRILLLTTTRPGLSKTVTAELGALEGFETIRLPRLGDREVIELLADALGNVVLAEKLGSRIAKKSDGIPLFIFELIKGLEEGRYIEKLPNGSYVETKVVEEIEVPSAVRDLVEVRLTDLTREERAVLDVAAVLGFEFESDLISRVRGMNRLRTLEALASIERRSGVVRVSGRRFRFDHHQILEVLYDAIPPELREEYHSLVAAALAAREDACARSPDELPGELVARLTHHHLRGSRPADCLPYLFPALRHLRRSNRHDACLRMLDASLAIPGLLDETQRAWALLRRSGSLRFLGRPAEQAEAVEEAAALAATLDDPGLQLRTLLGQGMASMSLCRYRDAEMQLKAARDRARAVGDRGKEITALSSLGAVCFEFAEHDRALRYFEEELELAREHGPPMEVARAYGNLGVTLFETGQYEAALARHQQNLAIAEEHGDRGDRLAVAGNLGQTLAALGRRTEAEARLDEMLAGARELGYRRYVSFAAGILALLHLDQGRLGDALDRAGLELGILREIGNPPVESMSLAANAHIRMMLGDLEGAELHLNAGYEIARACDIARNVGYHLYLRGLLAWMRGRTEEAIARFGESVEVMSGIEEMSVVGWAQLGMARIHRWTGAWDEARRSARNAIRTGDGIEQPDVAVQGRCLLASLPGEEDAEARERFREKKERMSFLERLEARLSLYRASGQPQDLEASCRDLEFLLENAPAEYHERMLDQVPLYREIVAARADAGRAEEQ